AEQEALRKQLGDEAVEAFRQSMLAGYADAAHVKTDTDLDALRSRPDFQALVARVGRKGKFTALGGEIRGLRGDSPRLVEMVVIPSDGSWALSSGYDNTVRLWDVASGKELRQLRGHKGLVHGLAFSTDGRRAATAGADNTVRLWDVASGKELHRFDGHT